MLYADKPDIVLELIRLWSQLYEGYLRNWTGPSDKQLRYLTFGCGGNIDDSKNNPGIDRTDDIKKGVYQMLKLGEHFSAKCKRSRIKIALLSNIHAVRHHRDYLSGFEELTWTYERCLEPTDDSEWKRVRVDDLINLYDAFIALSQPQFREEAFRQGFSLEYLLNKL
ncbi:MAG: hypothetical protein IT210_26520 [Armatimonadetes bacterium]|nr:hypothetical protein [Armatimonadota bacterium]